MSLDDQFLKLIDVVQAGAATKQGPTTQSLRAARAFLNEHPDVEGRFPQVSFMLFIEEALTHNKPTSH